MTTRKNSPLPLAACLFALATLAFSGCATPGLLHVYSLPEPAAPTIADAGPENAADTPSFVAADESVVGFAYDPFTDHFFLRLAPGDAIRVVDRPARAIKREYKVAALLAPQGGDLAIRPRDGHVFAVMPGETSLVEFSRYGDFIGRVPLENTSAPIHSVAFDSANNRLVIFAGDAPTQISFHTPEGRRLSVLTADRPLAPGCLAFDADKQELYAPLANRSALGVFSTAGKLLREISAPPPFFDVGPRSFLRLF